MPLDFPSSPIQNDTYTYNGVTYVFNGTGWVVQATTWPSQMGRFKNQLINGDFSVWQRTYSLTTGDVDVYAADHWTVSHGNGSGRNATYSRQTFTPGQTDVPGEPRYYFRWQETNAGSGYTNKDLWTAIEGMTHLAGRTMTLSFYAKADANITMPSLHGFLWLNNTSLQQIDFTIATNVAVGTAWQRFSFTFTVPGLSGYTVNNHDWMDVCYLMLGLPTSGTFTFDIARIQLEYGSEATDFEERPYAVELAMCQRYYEHAHSDTPDSESSWKTRDFWLVDGSPVPSDLNANYSYFYMHFRQPKPWIPTMTYYNAAGTVNTCSWERPGVGNSGSTSITIQGSGAFPAVARVAAGSAEGVPQDAYVYCNWEAACEF